jgi:capsular polysaccharide biosynthesis protein
MRNDQTQWEIEPVQGGLRTMAFREILRIYFSSFLIALIAFAGGVIFSWFAYLSATRVFEATGTFLVDELPFIQTVKQTDSETDRQLVQTLILSIANRDMRAAIEKRLDLTPGRIAFAGLDRAITLQGRQMEANVQVSLVKNSRMGAISADSQSPEFAAKVVNAMLDELGLYNIVGGRLKAIQTSAGFAKAQADSMLQQLADVSAQRIKLEREVAEMENYLKQNLPLYAYPAFAQDSTLNNLKTQLILVESEYKYLASTSTRGQRLEGKAAELKTLRSQLNSQASNLANALRAEYAIRYTQEQDLQANKLKAAQKLDAFSQESTRLAQSFGDPSLMRKLAAENPTDGNIGTANMVVIVNKASPPPRPIRPQLLLYLLFGGALGGMLGLGLAALVALLDNSVKSVRQIEMQLGIPCLAVLSKPNPTLSSIRKEGEINYSDSPAGIGFLRGHLLSMIGSASPLIVGFSPASVQQRSSVLVADLAFITSLSNKRTLVVDLHVEQPLIAKILGIKVQTGIEHWLRSEDPLENYINYSENKLLGVLSVHRADKDLLDDFARRPLEAEWGSLASRWDIILIDAPCVLSYWNHCTLPAGSPGIVTADFRKSKMSVLSQICAHARGPKWQLDGVVLTEAPARLLSI